MSPRALKLAIGKIITMFLGPLREVYDSSEEWQRVDRIAYLDTDGYRVAANGHAKSKDESRWLEATETLMASLLSAIWFAFIAQIYI